MDVDLDFEALFDAISQVMPPLHQFLMLSHAGIDDEVTGHVKFPGVENVAEYLNEQRYAAKVVDESEIPYTILRPVTMTRRPTSTRPKIIEEGQSVANGKVSYQNVAQVALDVIEGQLYVNQSIAIIDQK
ncbi:MAG: NAD(P)-dependent oxidoreductase [Acetilactobacillus jinshanensis]